MGIRSAFERGPNFLSMLEGPTDDISISDVTHKAFIDVTEEGTEAAAATCNDPSSFSEELYFIDTATESLYYLSF